jgi:amino acid adenylation domain-containing protein
MSQPPGQEGAAGRQICREVVTSFAQRRMWLLERINPGTPVYHISFGWRLRGPLHVANLRRAVVAVIDRHDALRTSFRLGSHDVMQRIGPRRPVIVPLTDLAGLPAAEREVRVGQALREAREAVLDLSTGDVFRARLLRLAADEHLLLVTVHHIVFDARSHAIFWQELAAFYDAFRRGEEADLPPLPLQYADFAVRQRQEVTGARLAGHLDYWRVQLRDLPNTEVAGRRPRPADPSWHGGRFDDTVPPELGQRVADLSRTARVTPFMVYLSIFQVLLRRYTDARSLSVVSPVSGRHRADVEDLIGLFLNTLVLRADLSGNPRFVDLLGRICDTALDAFTHQDVSFEHVVDELRPARSGGNPFTQVLFGMQNTPATPVALSGVEAERLEIGTTATRMDLRLMVRGGAGRARLGWIYRTELYDRVDVEGMSRHYRTLLQAAVNDPLTRIDELQMLSPAGAAEVISLGCGPSPPESDGTLHHRFGRQARATPETLAVAGADGELTYQQLDLAAARLADRLLQAGIARGDQVGIAIDRSVAMAVAVLGTLKVGGAYVPLDPSLPRGRIASIIDDATPVALLVAADRSNQPGADLVAGSGVRIVLAVDPAELLAGDGTGRPAEGWPDAGTTVATFGADVAYVLYTSGSTGQPKGVTVSHAQVLNYLAGVDDLAGLGPGRYAMVQPLAVDSSVTMLHGAWFGGGTLYPVDRHTALDGPALASFLRANRIDYLKIAPSHLEALQRLADPADLMPAQWLMIGGEASLDGWARNLAGLRPGCRVYNHYGPTETTVGVLAHRLNPAADSAVVTTPIGRPLTGVQIYVLDSAGQPVPPTMAGELYIGGRSVAYGYLGRPGETALRFLPDPFSEEPGARMYRSGDRARQGACGTVEFLGRNDDQVKIRGNRVELGEIAAVLRHHRRVAEAAVRAHETDGSTVVVAYVTPRDGGGEITPEEINGFLRQRLPEYMVPTAVVTLEALPLTRHGKLDAGALPPPPRDHGAGGEPATATERRVAAIWQQVLGVERVGRTDDFFQTGGHSLLATRLAGELERVFGVAVPVAAMFSHPTPASQAAFLEQTGSAPPRADGGLDHSLGRNLVRFAAGTAGVVAPALFCVHPISGTVSCYADLARHLPEYSLVGVESPDLATGRHPPRSVPDLAERYLAAIRASGYSGPYRFAGWSMGGLVAYEMAQQLADDSGPVERIVLIDTVVPAAVSSPAPEVDVTAAFIRDIAATLGRRGSEPSATELAMLDQSERLSLVGRWLVASGVMPDGLPAGELERRYAVFHAHYLAQLAYRPRRSRVPVTLIRPAAHSQRSERWRDLAHDLLTIKEFEGNHYSLLREPTVASFAGWLRRHLATAP